MARLRETSVRAGLSLVLGISAMALLSACDNGPSAVSKQAAGTQMATANAPDRSYNSDRGGGGYDNAPKVDHRKDEVAKADDGKPVWAPSKRFSAEEGARRQFERDGEAFQAKTLDQFVKKAHAFVGHPPKGTLTLTRKNGDILFYDPKDNVFAVSSKEGAPRTMFKPDDGMAYWEKQKDREERSQTARSGRKSRYADDQGE
jgi:pyocin large subunit-like protein